MRLTRQLFCGVVLGMIIMLFPLLHLWNDVGYREYTVIAEDTVLKRHRLQLLWRVNGAPDYQKVIELKPNQRYVMARFLAKDSVDTEIVSSDEQFWKRATIVDRSDVTYYFYPREED